MPGAINILDTTLDAGSVAVSTDKQTQAVQLQAVREGSPLEVMETLVELELSGDIEIDQDYVSEPDYDDGLDEELDSDVDSSEEEEPFLEGWDDDPYDAPETRLSGTSEEIDFVENGLDVGSKWRLIIHLGQCRFERPAWMRWRGVTKRGWQTIGDVERRFEMFERIAAWLNKNRSEYLANPDPWNLGVDVVKEFEAGESSVVPGDFIKMAGLEELCGDSLFSRYRSATSLIWDDGTQTLDALFGPNARMGWTARLVCAFVEQFRGTPREFLAQCSKVTVPKGVSDRETLRSADLDHLDWPELVARANLMAGSKWANVLKLYEKRILKG